MPRKRRKKPVTNSLLAETTTGMSSLTIVSEDSSTNITNSVISYHPSRDLLSREDDRILSWLAFNDESSVTSIPEEIKRWARGEELVCILTTRNPQKDKLIHEGKITCFRQLFQNSFLFHHLYNPESTSLASNFSQLSIPVFDGTKIEDFPNFEHLVLIKIVNNIKLDFEEKFLLLLNYLEGPALSVVQAFTEKLDIINFVHAIEALWYIYGEPNRSRNLLMTKIYHQEPVNLQRPETLLATASLIEQILGTFTYHEELAEDSLNKAIRMTKETTDQYFTWLAVDELKHSIINLKIWLEYSYRSSLDGLKTKKLPIVSKSKINLSF